MKHSLPENLLSIALIAFALYAVYVMGVAIISRPWVRVANEIERSVNP